MPLPQPVKIGEKIRDWLVDLLRFEKLTEAFKSFYRVVFGKEPKYAYEARMLADLSIASSFLGTPHDVEEAIKLAESKGWLSHAEAEEYRRAFIIEREKTEQILLEKIKRTLHVDDLAKIAAAIGEEVYSKILEAMGLPAKDMPADIRERIGRYLATISVLSSTRQAFGALAEITTLGAIDTVGDIISQVYWNLGLGFISWQLVSPLIEFSIRHPMEKWGNKYWRPHGLTPAQAVDAKMLNLISDTSFRTMLAEQGYDDATIDILLKLAYNPLPISEMWNAYENDLISEATVRQILRQHGYDESTIEIMIQNHRASKVETPSRVLRSTILNAYEAGIITESQAIEELRKLGYSEDEINWSLQLIKLEKQVKLVGLKTSQIKDGFMAGVLTEQDARYWLSQEGLQEEAIEVLLATWKAEQIKPERLLSTSSVERAYSYKVIDTEQARQLLLRLGYSQQGAEILLRTWDAAIAEEERRRGAEETPEASLQQRKITVSAILDAFQLNIITKEEAIKKLKDLGLSDEDIEIYISVALYKPVSPEKLPTKAEIKDWFRKGIINEVAAVSYLTALGLSEQHISYILQEARYEATPKEIVNMYLVGNISYPEALYLLVLHQVPIQKAVEMLEEAYNSLVAASILIDFMYRRITRENAKQLLREIGYSDKVIDKMIEEIED